MKRTPLRRRSVKREALYRGSDRVEGRRAFVARILQERPTCQGPWTARETLRRASVEVTLGVSMREVNSLAERCQHRSVDVHELLARSAGGSILDDANALALCRSCHDWIGNHPREALALGLRRSRYKGRNPGGFA